MAAYAALVSLANKIQQISCSDILSNPQIKLLHESVTFLQDFLDNVSLNNSEAIKCLEPKIRDVAYDAEDTIDSHISADNITICYEDLQKAVEEIYSLKEELMRIPNRHDVAGETQWKDELLPPPPAAAPSRPTMRSKNTAVGFDADMPQIKDRLIRGHSHLQIIPIVGMGGIGKTTLATRLYDDKQVTHHFDIRAWATVSQNHQVRRILLDLLACIKNRGNLEGENNEKLGELLYQSLKGWRYLIVMDDMWDGDIWDELRRCFPDDNNGSSILVTTRLGNVANHINPCGLHHHMHVLSKQESWHLLCEKVFAEDTCPPELEQIGKKIAEKCGGLPLAISVIGGLLHKVGNEQVADFWEHVGNHVSSYANTNDEQCSEVLLLSYNHLPQHLKACFLYMGIFPEDHRISIKKLIRLWAAEGFLKPVQCKTVEEVAEDYLKDLIDRNLVSICERGYVGRMKSCNMHDLLRDLCMRMCQVERLFHITGGRYHNDTLEEDICIQRRLAIHVTKEVDDIGSDDLLKNICRVPIEYLPRVRSLIFISCSFQFLWNPVSFTNFRLLRVLDADYYLRFEEFPEEILQMDHLRYLAIGVDSDIPSSISLLRNLQTMIVSQVCRAICIPLELLEMPQLRYLSLSHGSLPDTNGGEELCHLEAFSGLLNFKWSDEMIKRFPNLEKLKMRYSQNSYDSAFDCGLHNLVHLHKVERLSISGSAGWTPRTNEQWIAFPGTLKKLCLSYLKIPSNDHMANIGLLPNLEVVKFSWCCLLNPIWEPIEGGFPKLKYLDFWYCTLDEWRAESAHFPNLEHLRICGSKSLMEIPLGIGEIPTLQVIELIECSSSAIDSAKHIQEEQQELGNDQLHIIIT